MQLATRAERSALSLTVDLHQGRLRGVAPTVALHKERAEPLNPYVVFLLYLVAILGFVSVTLLLNRVLGPKPVAVRDQAGAVRVRRRRPSTRAT